MSNNKAIKFIRFLEIAWIIVGLTTVTIGIYETLTRGFEESYMFFIFAFVAGILYALRRKQRIGMEEDSKDNTNQD